MIDQPSLLIGVAIASAGPPLSAPQRPLASDPATTPVGSANASGEVGTRRAEADKMSSVRETVAARRDEEAAAPRPSEVDKPVSLADMWRTRLDPETFRMFTEVIDLETRNARYRVPPMPISDAAEQQGELRSQRERWEIGIAQSIDV